MRIQQILYRIEERRGYPARGDPVERPVISSTELTEHSDHTHGVDGAVGDDVTLSPRGASARTGTAGAAAGLQ